MSRTGRTSRILGPLAVALTVLASPVPASAATDATAQITAAINDFRVTHGLPSLPVYVTDVQVRRVHEHLVDTGVMHALFEESAAFYFDRGASNFGEVEAYVEGEDCSVDALLQQWIASDFHRGLLLTPDATHLVAAATCEGVEAWATGHVVTSPGTSDEQAASEQESTETDVTAPTATESSSTSDEAANLESAESTPQTSGTQSRAIDSQDSSIDTDSAVTVGDPAVSTAADPEVLTPSLGQTGGFELPRTAYWEAASAQGRAAPPLALFTPMPTTATVASQSSPPSVAPTAVVAALLISSGLTVMLLARRRRA